MNMTFETLYNFLTVAQEGSISAAARKLMIAQPALSKQIRALEQELGCTLFIRGSRLIQLTEAGRALCERVGQLRLMEASIRSQMRECSEGGAGILRLGITPYNSSALLEPLMSEFLRLYPGIYLDIHEATTFEVLSMLRAGIVEAGIVKTRFSGGPDIIVHCRVSDPLAAAWHPDFPFEPKGKTLTLKELSGVPLSVIRSFSELLKGYCAQEEFLPDIVCCSTQVNTNILWARLKRGVSIVPTSSLKAFPQLRAAVFSEKYMDSPATLITHAGSLSGPVRNLIRIYRETALQM